MKKSVVNRVKKIVGENKIFFGGRKKFGFTGKSLLKIA